MRILIVHYNDDNFGDVLLCDCFEQILKVVLENLNISYNDYDIKVMGLKHSDMKLVAESDMICFAGGGLFGLSYLDFYEPLKDIIETAENNNIPVIFSSMGVNNMDATENNEDCLTELLKSSCIKAISVRENPELFKKYAGESELNIRQVCDPAVWTKYVYFNAIKDILEKKKNLDKKVIGLNVTRGGLFVDNGREWHLTNEVNYLYELKNIIEEVGYECKFYTNGSTLDNNVLFFLKNKFNIPEEQIVYIDSTKELVETIAGFDAVAAIRMHSSIISYSMDIPVVNLVWNDKIPLFYEAINRPNGAIYLEDWTAENVYKALADLEKSGQYYGDTNYYMTLYSYLYDTLEQLLNPEEKLPQYTFEEVKAKLQLIHMPRENEIFDMKTKLFCGERRYYGQFMKLRRRDKEIKNLKNDLEQQKDKYTEQEKKLKSMKQSLKVSEKEIAKLQERLDRIDRMPVVRIYRKNKRVWKCVVGIFKNNEKQTVEE